MDQPREAAPSSSGSSLGQGEAFLTDLVKEVGGTVWWDEALRAAIVMLNGKRKSYLASAHKLIEGRTVVRREDFERDVMIYFFGVVPPKVQNPRILERKETEATVAWFTDLPSNSWVAIDSKAYGANDSTLAHTVLVTGLEKGKSYQAQVRCKALDDAPVATQSVTFSTSGLPLPTLSSVQVLDVGETQATVSWTTDRALRGWVTLDDKRFDEDTPGTLHKVHITGLERGRSYTAQLHSQLRDDAPVATQAITFSTYGLPQPHLSSIQVLDVGETQATICWTTDKWSTSQVTLDSRTFGDDRLCTFHKVLVTGLEPAKSYTAQLRSQTRDDAPAGLQPVTFTTYGVPKTSLYNVQVTDVGETQATLAWLTDRPATSQVTVGEKTFGDDALCVFHSVLLTGLEKGQPHAAQLRSQCRVDAPVTTQQVFFSTYGAPAPSLSSLQVVDVGETQATFTWNTNMPASSWVTIGPKRFGEERLSTLHRVTVTGLERGKSYAAQVLSQVREDAPATTQSLTFNTYGLPLPTLSSIQVLDVGETQVTLTWRTNIQANSQVLLGDKTFGEETLATFHKVRVTGLEPGKSYTAQLRSRSRDDASFATQAVNFSTYGLPQPSVSNVQVLDVGETQATLVWRTNRKTRSRVVLGAQTFGDDRLSTVHKLILTGLQPGKSYTGEIRSQARDDAPAILVPFSFSTYEVPHPTLSNIQVVDVSETQATFVWTTDRPASSWVIIGSQTHGESNRTTFHKVVVTGLEPGKPYTAQLRSQVREKAPVTTHALTLTTLGASTAPTPVPHTDVPKLYDGSKPAPGTTNTERWVPVSAPLRATPSQWSRALYDQVINQFAVEVNPRYQKGGGNTWCNIFAWDVTQSMGVEVPHWVDPAGNPVGVGQGKEMLANDMNRWLHTSGVKRGWRQVDANEAQRLANEGYPVIASQVDSSGGHIGVVRPGELTANGPASAQAGGTNFNHGHVYDSFSRESAEFWANDRREPAAERPTAPAGSIDVDSLGKLSARYESNGDPACVSSGKGDPGGVSYGLYQFPTSQGTARSFINWLQKSHPEYAKDFEGLTAGTQRFGEAWKAVAAREPSGFRRAQHEYIANEFYKKGKELTEAAIKGLAFDNRTQTLNDVLWSTAVQHGASKKGVVNIFQLALNGRNPTQVSDEELIKAVYAERGLKDAQGTLVHFTNSSAAVQKSVAQRFLDELADALDSVRKELASVRSKVAAADLLH